MVTRTREGPHNREDVDRVRDEYSKHGGENYDANDGTDGSVVGFATWGITKLIDVLSDKKHEIAGVQSG